MPDEEIIQTDGAPDGTLVAVKLALRVKTDSFDSEISDLIDAAMKDMGLAGITNDSQTERYRLIRAEIGLRKIIKHYSPDNENRNHI